LIGAVAGPSVGAVLAVKGRRRAAGEGCESRPRRARCVLVVACCLRAVLRPTAVGIKLHDAVEFPARKSDVTRSEPLAHSPRAQRGAA